MKTLREGQALIDMGEAFQRAAITFVNVAIAINEDMRFWRRKHEAKRQARAFAEACK